MQAGYVTFGSFNNPAKLSASTLWTWAELLARGSRLLLNGKAFAEAGTGTRLIEAMATHGVAPERIEAMGWAGDDRAHLSMHDRIDIALDPFPYNGRRRRASRCGWACPS
jgi:protein O-GlcNAc transferase